MRQTSRAMSQGGPLSPRETAAGELVAKGPCDVVDQEVVAAGRRDHLVEHAGSGAEHLGLTGSDIDPDELGLRVVLE